MLLQDRKLVKSTNFGYYSLLDYKAKKNKKIYYLNKSGKWSHIHNFNRLNEYNNVKLLNYNDFKEIKYNRFIISLYSFFPDWKIEYYTPLMKYIPRTKLFTYFKYKNRKKYGKIFVNDKEKDYVYYYNNFNDLLYEYCHEREDFPFEYMYLDNIFWNDMNMLLFSKNYDIFRVKDTYMFKLLTCNIIEV